MREDCNVLLWPWHPWVQASRDSEESGLQAEMWLLWEAETLNAAWGTGVPCTDVQLCAGGAQWSAGSSSWSKMHPGRLQDGAGFALWFVPVWLFLSLPIAPTSLSDCCLQTRC